MYALKYKDVNHKLSKNKLWSHSHSLFLTSSYLMFATAASFSTLETSINVKISWKSFPEKCLNKLKKKNTFLELFHEFISVSDNKTWIFFLRSKTNYVVRKSTGLMSKYWQNMRWNNNKIECKIFNLFPNKKGLHISKPKDKLNIWYCFFFMDFIFRCYFHGNTHKKKRRRECS